MAQEKKHNPENDLLLITGGEKKENYLTCSTKFKNDQNEKKYIT